MSIFSPSRCVLLLSDEGLHIYDIGTSKADLVDSVPWNTQDFEESVAELIRRKCRGKSVVLLNDMVEQHYRKERVPRVSPLDRANIVKRRVAAAFPSYPIRSAIKLKERPAAREVSGASDIYLLAAVPLSDNVRRTLDAVQRSYASIAGFCLLPIESASMVYNLSKKLAKLTDKPPVWTVFVGQHQSGGLRQIVTRNGELALTRMTPIVDSDADHDLWSAEVYNELKGTMSYLSRFGFDANDGLDVIVIANNSVADRITARVDFDCNLNILTVVEAANLLGVKVGRQEDLRYADPLHAAWSGRKSSFSMPLQAAQLEKIAGPARMATAASLLLLAACGYFGYQAYSQAAQWSDNSYKFSVSNDRLVTLKQDHAAEVQKKAAEGVDFLLIENSTNVYGKLEKMSMKPLPVLDTIGRALGPDLHIQSMDVRPVDTDMSYQSQKSDPAEPVNPDAPPKVGPPREFEIIIRIVFPSELAPEIGVQKIADLEARLRKSLPAHSVNILKQVADLSYTGNFVGETGSVSGEGKSEDYEAQIRIRGALI